MKKTSKIEMEGMLPDYALNRLDERDKAIFEANIGYYPELLQEIKNAQVVFSNFDAKEFHNYMDMKSKNISVKLMDRLCAAPKKSYGYIVKYLVPSLALSASALFLFFRINVNNTGNQDFSVRKIENQNVASQSAIASNSPIKEIKSVKRAPKPMKVAGASISSDNIYYLVSDLSAFDAVQDSTLDEVIGESIAMMIDNNFGNITTSDIESNIDPYEHLTTIDEDDFTKIFEELQNEKFHS